MNAIDDACSDTRTGHGSVLVALLIATLALGGLTAVMLQRSQREQEATAAADVSRALLSAEAGLDYNYALMDADPLWAVLDEPGFRWNETTRAFESRNLSLETAATGAQAGFRYHIQYLDGSTPVTFANRADPVESFDGIQVTCVTASAGTERKVAARYEFQLDRRLRGMFVSDMAPTGSGGGKGGARLGNIVFDGGGSTQFVHGDITANGHVLHDHTIMTEATAPNLLPGYKGTISQNLIGTSEEVPDFTSLGGNDQLFDFHRFMAAAIYRAGQTFTDEASFVAAMNAANAAGMALEGVTVIRVDPASWGNNPRLETAEIPGGINITGTLLFWFEDGTDADYRVCIEAPLHINAANLRGLDTQDPSTFTTGYPGNYANPSHDPINVDISPFSRFLAGDDVPALMSNNAVVAIHGAANVCGAVYGPSFIEIESKRAQLQYFSGAIYGGGGIFVAGRSPGTQLFTFDPNAVDNLATCGKRGKTLRRTGMSVVH